MYSPYSDPKMAQFFANASARYQFGQPAQDLVRLLNPSKSERFLDVGSGTGLIASAASQNSQVVAALDHSTAMLNQQSKNHRVLQVAGSAQDLPFRAETFDCVAAG